METCQTILWTIQSFGCDTNKINLEAKPVDKPDSESIFVALYRVRPCYPELPDVSWCGNAKRQKRKAATNKKELQEKSVAQEAIRSSGPVTRSMIRQAQSSKD